MESPDLVFRFDHGSGKKKSFRVSVGTTRAFVIGAGGDFDLDLGEDVTVVLIKSKGNDDPTTHGQVIIDGKRVLDNSSIRLPDGSHMVWRRP